MIGGGPALLLLALLAGAGGLVSADAGPICILPSGASSAATRQAMAHALGSWLLPDDQGGWQLTRDARLVPGRLRAVQVPSLLLRSGWLEAPVRRLMDPWLGGAAGIACNPHDGTWAATLDDQGHTRFLELLTLLERRQAQAPALVPGYDDSGRRSRSATLSAPLAWTEAAAILAEAFACPVAVAPGLSATCPALGCFQGEELVERLEPHGLRAAWIEGSLCLGRHLPVSRGHPASRRRLALVPVPPPVPDADRLATLARRLPVVAGWEPGIPGWGIEALPGEQPCLLVAADPVGIHAVLAVLARREYDGLGP